MAACIALSGYLCLAAEMLNRAELHGEAFNFWPQLQKIRRFRVSKSNEGKLKDINFEDISDSYTGPYESKLLS